MPLSTPWATLSYIWWYHTITSTLLLFLSRNHQLSMGYLSLNVFFEMFQWCCVKCPWKYKEQYWMWQLKEISDSQQIAIGYLKLEYCLFSVSHIICSALSYQTLSTPVQLTAIFFSSNQYLSYDQWLGLLTYSDDWSFHEILHRLLIKKILRFKKPIQIIVKSACYYRCQMINTVIIMLLYLLWLCIIKKMNFNLHL